MGLDTKGLEAACNRFKGVVDVDTLTPTDNYKSGTIARILSPGIFHSDPSVEGNGDAEEQREYDLDFGIVTEAELQEVLDKLLLEAKDKGLTESGQGSVKDLLYSM